MQYDDLYSLGGLAGTAALQCSGQCCARSLGQARHCAGQDTMVKYYPLNKLCTGAPLNRGDTVLLSMIMIHHYTEYYVQGLLITINKVIDGHAG